MKESTLLRREDTKQVQQRMDLPIINGKSTTTREKSIRFALAAAAVVLAFIGGAISFLVAYTLHFGGALCDGDWCSKYRPYAAVLPFSGAIRALVFARSRPWAQRRVNGFFDEVQAAIKDVALGTMLLIVFIFFFRAGYMFRDFSYSRLVVVYDWIVATGIFIALSVAMKIALVSIRRRGGDQLRVVVVQSPETGTVFSDYLSRVPELGLELTAQITYEPGDEARIALKDRLLEVAEHCPFDEIILLAPNIPTHELSDLVASVEFAHTRIKAVPELFGVPPSKVQIGEIGRIPLLSLLEEPLPGGRRLLKRTFDLVVAVPILLVGAPFVFLIGGLIKITSQGPVLLRQPRLGMDGRPFQMFKFRTMYQDVDDEAHREFLNQVISGDRQTTESLTKLENDPRITPIGRFLRRYSLDEIPQLLNVARGEMSIVGPRPSLFYELEMYQDWHRRRLEVRPGMTGLWQVSGRSRLDFHQMVQLDIQYIEKWSPLVDLSIIVRTVPALLRGETS